MFENIINFFKKAKNKEEKQMSNSKSKSTAKERLHLVLMQDRANVSADFLELMKQEIIEVIKKYIEVDEEAIDVRLTNQANEDGTNGAPALYANIPIMNIKNEARKDANEKFSRGTVLIENDKKEKEEINPESDKSSKSKTKSKKEETKKKSTKKRDEDSENNKDKKEEENINEETDNKIEEKKEEKEVEIENKKEKE
ncbi:MAG: cell division topological specificity factor MinE [Clostridia bacterium]|nr:cell division topological specificity factor MinE [Clostridia bacterium]